MQITQSAAQTVSNAFTGYASGPELYEGLFNPATNIQVGSDYFQYLYGRYGQDLDVALNHYGGTVKSGTYANDIFNCVQQLMGGNPSAAESASHGR